MAPKQPIATTTRVSEIYNFMEEDPGVYSDLEEPWKVEGYQEFEIPKNVKGLSEPVRTVVREVEKVKVVEVEVPGEGGTEEQEALTTLASLVQKQKATLADVGVQLPSTSGRKGHKVTGAIPKKRFPALQAKSLKCPVCDKVFHQHSKLVDHYVVYTKKSDFTCETCNQAFTNQTGLSNHEKLHSTYKCYLTHACPVTFATKKALATHLNSVQEYVVIDKALKCPCCLRSFASRDIMLKHKKHNCYHNPDVQIHYLFCKYCGSRYREKKYLSQHEGKCTQKDSKSKPGRKGGKGGKGGKKT